MTQDERWLLKYIEVKEFMEREHRNPSKHRIEEHDMVNWMKAIARPLFVEWGEGIKMAFERCRRQFFVFFSSVWNNFCTFAASNIIMSSTSRYRLQI